MCDMKTIAIIKDIVGNKITSNVLFTAFDVTLDVQAELKNQNLFDVNSHRHRHLKNDIHDEIMNYVNNGDYRRNLQDVGADSKAFVYCPVNADPANYIPINNLHTIHVSPAQNDGDEIDTDRQPDSRGTLCVPSNLLRTIGLGPKDSAYVFCDDNKLNIAKSTSKPILAGYTVDDSNNVRITKFVLVAANLNFNSYDFALSDNKTKIIITGHK